MKNSNVKIEKQGSIFFIKDRKDSDTKRPYIVVSNDQNPYWNKIQCFKILANHTNKESMVPIEIRHGVISYINPFDVHTFGTSYFENARYAGAVSDFVMDICVEIYRALITSSNVSKSMEEPMDILKLYQEEFKETHHDITEFKPRKSINLTIQHKQEFEGIGNFEDYKYNLKEPEKDKIDFNFVNHIFPRFVNKWSNDELLTIEAMYRKKGWKYVAEMIEIKTYAGFMKRLHSVEKEIDKRNLTKLYI